MASKPEALKLVISTPFKKCAFFRCRWFCHFDDDNYVNVPRLVEKLSEFDHRQDWYLGKPSLPEPLEILDRDNHHHQVWLLAKNDAFWHANIFITFRRLRIQCDFGLQPAAPAFAWVNPWPLRCCLWSVVANSRLWEIKSDSLMM